MSPKQKKLELLNSTIYRVQQDLAKNKFTLDEIGEYIPGLLHINSKEDLRLLHMAKSAERWLGMYLSDILDMGLEYFERHIEQNTWKVISQIFLDFAQSDQLHKIHSNLFFYRKEVDLPFMPMVTNIKIIPDSNSVLSLTIPLEHLDYTASKLRRVIEHNDFFRKNFERFSTLSKREVEVLTHIALGYTNKEISEMLFISSNTVRTHRNNITKKLEIKHFRDVIKYAQAFDLI